MVNLTIWNPLTRRNLGRMFILASQPFKPLSPPNTSHHTPTRPFGTQTLFLVFIVRADQTGVSCSQPHLEIMAQVISKAPNTPRPMGRFELLKRLGEGGMGIVYEALDRERRNKVALKTMRSLTGEALLQFKKEFRLLQDLEHPNLVHLYELLEDDGRWYFTMELIQGANFIDYVRDDLGTPTDDRSAVPMDSISSARTLNATPSPATSESPVVLAEPLIPTSSRFPLPGAASKVRFDESRLRSALVGLAYGLNALHGAGKVHRDVKPSNVIVTPEGRVVVLDFGLVMDTSAPEETTNHEFAGTLDYMAPEQASAGKVGPEADWYSVGVMLYEALTRHLPFRGNPFEVMQAKQKLTPIPPRKMNPYVPPHLDTLCMELLDFDPRRRANGTTILSRLGVKTAPEPGAASSTGRLVGTQFVGRHDELGMLRQRYDAMVKGTATAVLVEGESGVGKSALVATFLERIKAESPQTLVLSGRCYERESVPYKALDGVIDQLSRFLKHLEPSEIAAVFPRHGRLLGAAFPVLRQVRAIAEAPAVRGETQVSPQERRSRLFAAVRDLFCRVADKYPVVISIDDLQWADADSFSLLTDILQPPEQPILLALATIRTGDNVDAAFTSFKTATLEGSHVRSIALNRLPETDAQELAGMLVGKLPDDSKDRVLALTAEAGGHPLFIRELVLHAISQGSLTDIPQHLDEALWARVQSLTEGARKILELVSLAGKPIAQKTISTAAGIAGTEFSRGTSLLRVHCLVQTTGARSTDKILPYHGRVCEAIVGRLDEATRRQHHHELAVALEAEAKHDTEMLAMHWHLAGDAEHALTYALLAASEAEQVLAFSRAADLYRMALEIGNRGDKESEIRIKCAEALASAGRGAEAAEAYLIAARDNPKRALDLRRLAAAKFLHSGLVDKGLTELRYVLRAFGIWYPRSPVGAIVLFIFWRIVLRIRGFGFRERTEAEAGIRSIRRLDVLWSAYAGLFSIDHVRAAAFGGRMLLLALRTGEPNRLVQGLALEISLVSLVGVRAEVRAERLLKLLVSLADKSDQSRARACVFVATGNVRWYSGHFREAIDAFEQAEKVFGEQCVDASWEIASIRWGQLSCAFMTGQLKRLATQVPACLREAKERGDLYFAAVLRLGLLNSAWLIADTPTTAAQMAQDAMTSWTTRGFHIQHWHARIAQANLDLYLDRPQEAYDRNKSQWKQLLRSRLLRAQITRATDLHMRARTAIALARISATAKRDELLTEASHAAQSLCHEGAEWTRAWGEFLLACIQVITQPTPPPDFLKSLDQVICLLDRADLSIDAAIARRAKGKLIGGDEGKALVLNADNCMADQGIKNPTRWIAMIAPGMEDL